MQQEFFCYKEKRQKLRQKTTHSTRVRGITITHSVACAHAQTSNLSKVNFVRIGGVYSFQRQECVSKVKLSDHHNRSFDKCYVHIAEFVLLMKKHQSEKGFKVVSLVNDLKRLEFRMTENFA